MALPRYQNIGVAAGAGVGPIDFPNRGEATRGYDALSTAMNTMSEAFFGEARTAATEEGKKYGAEMAPTQEQIKLAMETGQPIAPVGDSRTYFGKAAQSTAAQIGAINVEARAKMDLTEIEKGIKSGAIGINEIVPKVNALTQGYSQALSQFDPVMAKRLEAELAKDGNTLFLAASSRAAAAAAAAAKRDTEAIIKHKIDFLPNVIAAGDTSFVDFESGKTVTRSMNDAVNNEVAIIRQHISKLKPDEQEKYWNSFYKKTAEGVDAYVKTKAIETEDPITIRKELESGKFDAMLGGDKLARSVLVEWTKSYENKLKADRENALRVERAEYKDALDGTMKALRDGVSGVDLSVISEARITKLFGEEAPGMVKKLKDAVRFNSALQGLALLPPQEQEKALNEARARIPKGGADYDERRDEAAAIERAISTNRQKILKDPASYVLESPEVRRSADNLEAVLNDPSQSQDARNAAIDRYVTTSLNMQAYLGVPEPDRKILTPARVDNLVNTFNSLTNSGQTIAQVIQQESVFWGKHWPIIERQLLAEKVPQEVGVVANLMAFEQRAAAQELSLALQPDAKKNIDAYVATVPDANKDLKASITQNMESFKKSLQNVGGGPDQFNAYSTAIETLAKRYMFTKGASAKDAATQAFKDIIAQSYEFVSTGPDTIRVPRRTKEGMAIERGKTMGTIFATDDLVRGLNHIRANIEDQPIPFDQFPSAAGLPLKESERQAISSLKSTGKFVTNFDETGVNLYASDGKVVRDKDGKPLTYTWGQLVEFGAMRREALTGPRQPMPQGR